MAIENPKDSSVTFDPSLTASMEGYKPVNEKASKVNIATSGYKPERNQSPPPVKIKQPQKK
ncbi:hypothetical protein Pcaca05_01160 [Pectobacterium carotovorum subsp. carotovorum]|nr:hypothetical protein Pcaca05_01160 [Pectobacterium carotovorum subsp. carotovorum]